MDMIGAIDKWASVLIRSSAKELVGGHVRVSVTTYLVVLLRWGYGVRTTTLCVLTSTIAPAWVVECCESMESGITRTLYLYAGCGVLGSLGRRQYINRLWMEIATLYRSTDGYLLPNKQVEPGTKYFEQVTGIAT